MPVPRFRQFSSTLLHCLSLEAVCCPILAVCTIKILSHRVFEFHRFIKKYRVLVLILPFRPGLLLSIFILYDYQPSDMPFLASLIPNGACQTLGPKVMGGCTTADYACLARVKNAPHADAAIFLGARVCVVNFV